ncbi:MAG: NYN domain-containing protein [Patescibacteria group bacterium]|nr:NYN domain-containing protein [Patescibacteria group bacterium]
MKSTPNNLAFIDGQNLYMGTTSPDGGSWRVDLTKFRVYLNQKYGVSKALYFLGYVNENFQELYEEIQAAGFILVFKQHTAAMMGQKKGNVDTDIVFNIMRRLYKKDDFEKIVLVSGDGDYKNLVDFLIEEGRLEKVLAPCRKRASSLYKQIGSEYFDCLDSDDIKRKIEKVKQK